MSTCIKTYLAGMSRPLKKSKNWHEEFEFQGDIPVIVWAHQKDSKAGKKWKKQNAAGKINPEANCAEPEQRNLREREER